MDRRYHPSREVVLRSLDIFTEMRLSALIHQPRGGPTSMSAADVLGMATRGGARALGLQDDVGSLEPGKKADLITVDLNCAHATPLGDDPVSALVCAMPWLHLIVLCKNALPVCTYFKLLPQKKEKQKILNK